MSEEANGGDALLDAISGQDVVEGIVTGYVVIASFLDRDGESCVFSDTLHGQRCHQTLGLLGFATAVETHKAAAAYNERHGDDDDD